MGITDPFEVTHSEETATESTMLASAVAQALTTQGLPGETQLALLDAPALQVQSPQNMIALEVEAKPQAQEEGQSVAVAPKFPAQAPATVIPSTPQEIYNQLFKDKTRIEKAKKAISDLHSKHGSPATSKLKQLEKQLEKKRGVKGPLPFEDGKYQRVEKGKVNYEIGDLLDASFYAFYGETVDPEDLAQDLSRGTMEEGGSKLFWSNIALDELQDDWKNSSKVLEEIQVDLMEQMNTQFAWCHAEIALLPSRPKNMGDLRKKHRSPIFWEMNYLERRRMFVDLDVVFQLNQITDSKEESKAEVDRVRRLANKQCKPQPTRRIKTETKRIGKHEFKMSLEKMPLNRPNKVSAYCRRCLKWFHDDIDKCSFAHTHTIQFFLVQGSDMHVRMVSRILRWILHNANCSTQYNGDTAWMANSSLNIKDYGKDWTLRSFPKKEIFGSLFDRLIAVFKQYKPGDSLPPGWNIVTQDASGKEPYEAELRKNVWMPNISGWWEYLIDPFEYRSCFTRLYAYRATARCNVQEFTELPSIYRYPPIAVINPDKQMLDAVGIYMGTPYLPAGVAFADIVSNRAKKPVSIPQYIHTDQPSDIHYECDVHSHPNLKYRSKPVSFEFAVQDKRLVNFFDNAEVKEVVVEGNNCLEWSVSLPHYGGTCDIKDYGIHFGVHLIEKSALHKIDPKAVGLILEPAHNVAAGSHHIGRFPLDAKIDCVKYAGNQFLNTLKAALEGNDKTSREKVTYEAEEQIKKLKQLLEKATTSRKKRKKY